MYMMHDNAITREDIKTVIKQSIIFTWWKFKRKMPTQRKPSRAVGTENADISHVCTQKKIILSNRIRFVTSIINRQWFSDLPNLSSLFICYTLQIPINHYEVKKDRFVFFCFAKCNFSISKPFLSRWFVNKFKTWIRFD